MRMHDNGEILVLPLNNNMSPEGLLKWAPAISWHDRDKESWRTSREQKVKGGGGWWCCWGKSWTLKWQTEGINERAGRLRAMRPEEGGKLYCTTDNEVTKSKEITSAVAIRNFSYFSPLRHGTPSMTEAHTIQYLSQYEHTIYIHSLFWTTLFECIQGY